MFKSVDRDTEQVAQAKEQESVFWGRRSMAEQQQPATEMLQQFQRKTSWSVAQMLEHEPVQRQTAVESAAVLRRSPELQARNLRVQRKLTIGQAGDKYEQEADRVAAAVVQQIHRKDSEDAIAPEEQKTAMVRRLPSLQQADALGGGTVTPEVEREINRARGGGQPLDSGLQRSMGAAMGADFSGVRVHTGPRADALNQALQAKAFTIGQDVFFRAGGYQPGSRAGQGLIAHELTHVVQQNHRHVNKKSIASVQHRVGCGCRNCRSRVRKSSTIQAKRDNQVHSEIAAQYHSDDNPLEGFSKVESGNSSGSKIHRLVGEREQILLQNSDNNLVIQRDIWDYLTTLGISLTLVPYEWVIGNLTRIPRLIGHLLMAGVGTIRWLWNGIMTLAGQRNQTLMQWLFNGFRDGATWIFQLLSKVSDVLGLPEVINLLMNFINFYTRPLTGPEKAAGQIAYGNTISYWKVKVSTQQNIITALYNLVAGGMIAITAFHYIEVNLAAGNAYYSANMVHELGHVKQYESVGSRYMGEAIHAALAGAGYLYNPQDLFLHPLSWFNREQQCRIAEHYWAFHTYATIAQAAAQSNQLNLANLQAGLNFGGHPHTVVGAQAYYQGHINDFRAGRV